MYDTVCYIINNNNNTAEYVFILYDIMAIYSYVRVYIRSVYVAHLNILSRSASIPQYIGLPETIETIRIKKETRKFFVLHKTAKYLPMSLYYGVRACN